MRIAVTYEDGEVFQHFGHTQQFKFYDVENGTIQNEQIVDTQGSGHGALAGFLTGYGVNTLLCGGIGGGAAGCACIGWHTALWRHFRGCGRGGQGVSCRDTCI